MISHLRSIFVLPVVALMLGLSLAAMPSRASDLSSCRFELRDIRPTSSSAKLIADCDGKAYEIRLGTEALLESVKDRIIGLLEGESEEGIDFGRVSVSSSPELAFEAARAFSKSKVFDPALRFSMERSNRGLSLVGAWIRPVSRAERNSALISAKTEEGRMLRRWLGAQNESGAGGLGHLGKYSSPNLFLPELDRLTSVPSSGDQAAAAALLEKIASVRFDSWVRAFSQSGFPPKLSQLYAAKLIARAMSLSDLYGVEIKLPEAPRPEQISEAGFIRQGWVIANYPDFPMPVTGSEFGYLFSRYGDPVVKGVENLAKQILRHTPFQAASKGDQPPGEVQFGLGGTVRIKRKISENPSPSGADDLYLVKDEVQIYLSIAAVMEFARTPIWANLGPTWARRFVRVRTARTRADAEKGYWSIPKEILVDAIVNPLGIYQKLRPGESFFIHDTLGFGPSAGGSLIRIPEARLTATTSAGVDGGRGVQMSLDANGAPLLIHDKGMGASLEGSVYGRVDRAKALRIQTVAGAVRAGKQQFDIYTYDPAEFRGLDQERRRILSERLRATIQNGDFENLPEDFHRSSFSTDYELSSGRYYLFAFSGSSDFVSSVERISTESGTRKMYFSRLARERATNWGGDKGSRSCEARGALEYASPDDDAIRDGAIQITCRWERESADRETLSQAIADAEKSFGLKPGSMRKLDEASGGEEGQEVALKARASIPWSELRRWVSNDSDRYSVEEVRDRIRGRSYILEGRTPEKRMDRMVEMLGVRGLQNDFRASILSEMQNLKIETRALIGDDSLLTPTRAYRRGQVSPSAASRYLSERDAETKRLYAMDY